MTVKTILLTLLALALGGWFTIWWYASEARQDLKRLHEKADAVIENQEGGRMQAGRQADEIRHQQTRIMERLQFLLLRAEQWWKDRNKGDPP